MKQVTQLVKGKKTCPFLYKNFDIDITQQHINKDLVKQFGKACPYLITQKMQKKTQEAKLALKAACERSNECDASIGKCPFASMSSKLMEMCKLEEQKKKLQAEQEEQYNYSQQFTKSIKDLKEQNRYRYFNTIERISGKYPYANLYDEQGLVKQITVWCSNDYLGMGQIQSVQDAMINSVKLQGIGAGGTRNIGGSSIEHLKLEKDLANFHDKEASVLCTSCFVANQSAMNALARVMPDIVFLSDEKNHASIIEGIKNSKAEKVIFKHNDIVDLEKKLKKIDKKRPKCIIFESVYSMSGNISPIDDICNLAKKYNAMTFIDEVHAIGLYGPRGGGVAQQLGVDHKLDFISGTLSKGVGCFGGYVVGKKESIDCIRSYAPNFIFTTSIPPSLAAAARQSLKVISEQQKLRDDLHNIAFKLKTKFYEIGIRMEPSHSHIVPVFIGNAKKAKQISDMLLKDYGHYIQAINFPTVAKGEELLRISPTPHHTQEMIDSLADAILQCFKKYEVHLYKGEEIFMNRGDDYKLSIDDINPFDSSTPDSFFNLNSNNIDHQPEVQLAK